eukprot:CAMPEP_0195308280 /NCGR_PEP_ID=MMETSP0707-20130614/38145_1 /TAXON_ID=33640 /ORGANISM="Asterionellopsis glacialis, Strain CCMP134" /LENGTH=394 /DNA_ID=CAMNT_0040372545 /DNA_START=223 /DNA_END=1407 /DNA_ORIENTATION=-
MTSRHKELLEKMMSEDAGEVDALGKELSKFAPVASLKERMDELQEEEQSLRELMKEASQENDKDMENECQDELQRISGEREKLEQRIIAAVLPRDEDDYSADAVLEIRAGTGGEEAALFAGELLEAYTKIAKGKNWKLEELNVTKTDIGGIKEASISISSGSGGGSYGGFDIDENDDPLSGLGPCGYFRFESGVHRVQRVPVNDVRMHTSACSVAVLPYSDDNDQTTELLPTSELKIETMRSSGAGGQHVNTTESAVRITHIPTGITAAIQDERSQHKNRAKAMKLITARVRDKQREEEARERGDARQSLMGGGDRSERIRTYNFPQDRVTDHRCKESEHGIAKLLGGAGDNNGGLVAFFAPYLREMHREELMEQLENEPIVKSRSTNPKGKQN